MKSKEEIIKGLSCCIGEFYEQCEDCPYEDLELCNETLLADVIEAIEKGGVATVPHEWKEAVMKSFLKVE